MRDLLPQGHVRAFAERLTLAAARLSGMTPGCRRAAAMAWAQLLTVPEYANSPRAHDLRRRHTQRRLHRAHIPGHQAILRARLVRNFSDHDQQPAAQRL